MQTDALVKQAQNGDKQAIAELWDILTPKLFGYLVNVVRDKSLAEDLLQATWLKAVTNLNTFRDRGNTFSAWLFAIAKNECRQHWRKNHRETLADPLEYDQPDDKQTGDENKILVDQLLNLLSEEDRELLRLRYIADLPINDIARILNINFVAVRVRLHRAIGRAQAALKEKKL